MTNKKINIAILLVLFSFVLSSLLTGSSSAAEKAKVYNWKLGHLYPRADATFKNTQLFCEWVKEASEGQLKITPYGVGEIVPSKELTSAVKMGTLQMSWDVLSYLGKAEPIGGLSFSMPFGLPNMIEVTDLYFDKGMNELLREVTAKHNIFYLGPVLQPGAAIITKKPVKNLKDLKGLKMRSFGTGAAVLQKLGVSVAFIPFDEIYFALSTGVIDGVIMSLTDMNDKKIYETVKYVIHPEVYSYQACDLLVNMDAWKELPDNLKAILSIAARAHSIREASALWAKERTLVSKFKEAGVEFKILSEEEQAKLQKVGNEVWTETAGKNPSAIKFLKIYKDYMRTLGYLK